MAPAPGGIERRKRPESRLAGLDLLASAVVVLDVEGGIGYLNHAAEELFEISLRTTAGQRFSAMFSNGAVIEQLLAEASIDAFGEKAQELRLERALREPLHLQSVAVVMHGQVGELLIEFREIDKRMRIDREERILDSVQVNRELVRNLAHEIKNPLGGIRGAAQLLESELGTSSLCEYTQVIIKESDRLQMLVDRLLAPHRHPRLISDVNIHEIFERVRSVLLAEYPQGLVVERDYDASLPEFRADKSQLIQAMLNLARNAAQALGGRGRILFRTRVARQVTIAKQRYRLAFDLHVIDDGPGIPAEIRDRIFYPLVSGREGGTGLGLTLAQTFVQQHGGTIECESWPGHTDFRILLPLP